jgi:hypothetical protein
MDRLLGVCECPFLGHRPRVALVDHEGQETELQRTLVAELVGAIPRSTASVRCPSACRASASVRRARSRSWAWYSRRSRSRRRRSRLAGFIPPALLEPLSPHCPPDHGIPTVTNAKTAGRNPLSWRMVILLVSYGLTAPKDLKSAGRYPLWVRFPPGAL